MTGPSEFGLEIAHNPYLLPDDEEVHAVISVTAPAGPPAVVFLVDRSASMRGPGMAVARQALRRALDALPDGALFAVIAGSDEAEMCYPPEPRLVTADVGSRAAAKLATARLSASGGTAIGQWLTLANTLFDDPDPSTRHAILLADEGNTHETPGELARALEACRGRFTCDCLGSGLTMIAETLGGTAESVAPERLPDEFEALTRNAIVANLALLLALPEVAELLSVRQIYPTQLELAGPVVDQGVLRFAIGSSRAARRDFHVVIRVPPADVGTEMLAARVTLVRAGVLARDAITVRWTDEPVSRLVVHGEPVARSESVGHPGLMFPDDFEMTAGPVIVPSRPRPDPGGLTPGGGVGGPGGGPGGGAGGAHVPPREPVVNTGFATPEQVPLSPERTLTAGGQYLFWVDIGLLDPYSIEDAPGPLPVDLPPHAELTVALFEFVGEIGVDPANAVVRMVPGERVWLPVRLPSAAGVWRVRCGIYWRQVLLESRVITVHATAAPETMAGALRSTVDYRLANPAEVEQLLNVPAHTASLFLNDNGDGSHALRVLATDGRELLRTDATFTAAQLTTQIRLARGALRRVAWGTDAPWRDGDDYRYATAATPDRLAEDLTRLARNGFRLHHLLLRSLGRTDGAGTYAMADRLAAALGKPGVIQVALKDSAQHVLPVALLYDLPLDTNADRLTLCADFVRVWREGRPLAGTACFDADCRQARDPDDTVVCPGGFWGYRHALGLPVSTGRGATLPQDLAVAGEVKLAAGLYRDFRHVDAHCRRLHDLLPGVHWRLNDDRDAVLEELRTGSPDIVYFYCHGGVAGDVPYLRVGRGTSGPVITPDNLFRNRIQWPSSRPLVFLNGCQTTDLEPERAIDFVSFFVEDASACGVIGTEITVFEEFAREFAEEFLHAFLTDRVPIGTAVTRARLALLSKGNPLGLSYIPYALPSIRLATTP